MSLLPDWNSIESTTRWSDGLFWAGIVALVLLAATEVASHIYANRAAYLVSVRAQIESETRQHQDAQAQARHDAETAALRQQALDAQNTAAQAQKKVEAIQTPRSLKADEKTKLVQLLIKLPKGRLVIQPNSNVEDAREYGEEIAALLRDQIGWTVRVDNVLIMGTNLRSAWFVVQDPQHISLAAMALIDAFSVAKIPLRNPPTEYDPSLSATDADIWLKIGSKP